MTRRVLPLSSPVDAKVRPPGSKSETIRVLAIAALASGRSHVYGGLAADDPKAMARALRQFGIGIETTDEPWRVEGSGGLLAEPEGPIDVGESGLTARIAIALASATEGTSTITGRGRLPDRPMTGLIEALRRQGAEVAGDRLPVRISGRHPLWGGGIEVDCTRSSQHATAVMIIAPLMAHPVTLEVVGLSGSAGYLRLTAATMQRFGVAAERTITGYEIPNEGYRATDVVVEPDASAAVYPMAIAAITGSRITVEGLARDSLQPDVAMAEFLAGMGCSVEWTDHGVTVEGVDPLAPIEADLSGSPDAALALAVACLFAEGTSRLTGLGSLRDKESDRLAALEDEMTRLGARVIVGPDRIDIHGPATLHGAVVDPHGDHRIAMAMAMAGTRVPGISVSHAEVVAKTWPGFWDALDDLAR